MCIYLGAGWLAPPKSRKTTTTLSFIVLKHWSSVLIQILVHLDGKVYIYYMTIIYEIISFDRILRLKKMTIFKYGQLDCTWNSKTQRSGFPVRTALESIYLPHCLCFTLHWKNWKCNITITVEITMEAALELMESREDGSLRDYRNPGIWKRVWDEAETNWADDTSGWDPYRAFSNRVTGYSRGSGKCLNFGE